MSRGHQDVVRLFAQDPAPVAARDKISRVRHAAMRTVHAYKLGAAQPALQVFVEAFGLEVDAATKDGRLRHAALARLPPKPNRYCATRRICTSSVPSVMR